ncbi:MAG TPA: hypothetical protein VM717_01010 [Chthoniobacterales bacterium]|nr:hypothetical protein [Chthoniobacterales bacterium]
MAEVDLPQQFVGRFCNVGLSVPSRSHFYSNHPAAVHVEEVTKWKFVACFGVLRMLVVDS